MCSICCTLNLVGCGTSPWCLIIRQEDSGEGPSSSVDPILEELVEDKDE